MILGYQLFTGTNNLEQWNMITSTIGSPTKEHIKRLPEEIQNFIDLSSKIAPQPWKTIFPDEAFPKPIDNGIEYGPRIDSKYLFKMSSSVANWGEGSSGTTVPLKKNPGYSTGLYAMDLMIFRRNSSRSLVETVGSWSSDKIFGWSSVRSSIRSLGKWAGRDWTRNQSSSVLYWAYGKYGVGGEWMEK